MGSQPLLGAPRSHLKLKAGDQSRLRFVADILRLVVIDFISQIVKVFRILDRNLQAKTFLSGLVRTVVNPEKSA